MGKEKVRRHASQIFLAAATARLSCTAAESNLGKSVDNGPRAHNGEKRPAARSEREGVKESRKKCCVEAIFG